MNVVAIAKLFKITKVLKFVEKLRSMSKFASRVKQLGGIKGTARVLGNRFIQLLRKRLPRKLDARLPKGKITNEKLRLSAPLFNNFVSFVIELLGISGCFALIRGK